MPTSTYVPLATTTLGSSASSITFSSIPATYRDLIIVGNPLGAEAAARFNGDSGSNYNGLQMWGNGSNPLSSNFSATSSFLGGINQDPIAQIMDYSATDKHKMVLVRRGIASATFVAGQVNRWANTSAITTIAIIATSGSFTAGSRFDLYGIVA
jgi:hypothetical protein